MNFQRFAAQPALADALDHVWLLQGEGAAAPAQPIWPDGCPEWVFQLADPFEQQTGPGHWQRQGSRLLVGQQLARELVRPGARVRCLGLHFKPQGLACFLAGDLRRHTGAIVALDAALGTDLAPLAATLQGLDDAGAQQHLQQWLQTRRLRPADALLAQALERLAQPGQDVRGVAQALGCSERQLRRRFEAAVGLAPKRWARLARFQRVVQAGRLDDAKAWVEAALEGGYCDQAHFSRDFRAFTGAAPRALLRDLGPLTAFFLAMSDSSKTAR